MRIAMILATSYTIDPRVDKEARDLAAAGHDVTVLAWDRTTRLPGDERRMGFRIRRFAVQAGLGRGAAQIPALARFYRAVWRELGRGAYEALHCHDLETLPLGWLAARRLRLPLVFDAHEPCYYGDARRLRGLLRAMAVALEVALVPRADAVLVTNGYQMQRYRRLRARRLRLVANWPERRLVAAAAAAPAERPLTIGRLGSLYFDMGIEALVEAHRILRQEFPGLRLLIAGQVTPGYEAPLRRAAGESAGVEVRPAYRYEDIPALYAEIDVAVLPQEPTPWFRHITPTKFYEALARGVPVVTTNIGDLGDLVRAHGAGALLRDASAGEIASRVRPFLRDPDLRARAGAAARRLVARELHWDRSRAALLDVYAGIAARRPAGAAPTQREVAS